MERGADIYARAIVRATAILRADPLTVFVAGQVGKGQPPRRKVRILAAAGLRREGATASELARTLAITTQELAPSQLVQWQISGAMVEAVAAAVRGEAQAMPAPAPIAKPPGPIAAALRPAAIVLTAEPPDRRFVGDICGRMEADKLPAAAEPRGVPAFSGARTAGKPKPNGVQRSLLDVQGLASRVFAMRSKTPPTPWSHIARQTGKPESSLRQAFDPDWGRARG